MKNPTGSSKGGDEQRDNDELKASRSSDFDVTQFCDKENEMKQIQFFENMQKDGRAFQITMNTILCCLFLKIMGNITWIGVALREVPKWIPSWREISHLHN